MAAQLKEVIVDANLPNAQHLRPDRGKGLLGGRLRRGVFRAALQLLAVRSRPFAVGWCLAVGVGIVVITRVVPLLD